MIAERWAIYYAPEDDAPLARFGNSWLGRDPRRDMPLPRPPLAGFSPERLAALTAEPQRYGFHGTLKPPFVLAEACQPEALRQAIATLAASHRTIALPPWCLADLDGFLALVPAAPCPALGRLADACVRELDGFRAPASAEELARRRAAGLSPGQDALLTRWGYPYVGAEFRFHLTLTGRISDPAERKALRVALDSVLAALLDPAPALTSLSLFHQPAATRRFFPVDRFALKPPQ
ncbi:MAG: DUF1045 domain-containing protein [Azospirillum sp.]|nr:DUF1045 domain-containing protein [Azospirillum sp.]